MNKELLKIDFESFWPNFQKQDNYFFNLLNQKYNVVIDEQSPDLLFLSYDYSGMNNHDKYINKDCKKIFYTGENYFPENNFYDYTFTFRETNANNVRLPLWVMHINWFNRKYSKKRDIGYQISLKKLLNENFVNLPNKNFCSFVSSQPKGKRVDFVPEISNYKNVDCGGRLYNNTKLIKGRGDQKWKYSFLSKYRFNIAFENTIGDGYVTEKIIQPMSENSIPIYWGSDYVKSDFNPDSIIYADDFENDEHLIEYILELENNQRLYLEKLNNPWFKNNNISDCFLPDYYLKIFSETILN